MDFPPLPGYNKVYRPFGSHREYNIKNDSINQLLEKQLKEFKYCKIVAPKTIEFYGHSFAGCYRRHVFVKKASTKEKTFWFKDLDQKLPVNIESHVGKYQLHENQTYEEVEKDTFDICDPASNFIQRVKFR